MLSLGGIFYLFDYVHLLKLIRNSWYSAKDLCWVETDETGKTKNNVASWSVLVDLFSDETTWVATHGAMAFQKSRLTKIAVGPKPIERQWFGHALSIFHPCTIAALETNKHFQSLNVPCQLRIFLLKYL